jgi:hypothetical protein
MMGMYGKRLEEGLCSGPENTEDFNLKEGELLKGSKSEPGQ